MSKSAKRRLRRLRNREHWRMKNWKHNPTAKTPYEDWTDWAAGCRRDVTTAVTDHPGLAMWYRQDRRRPRVPIEVEDLALALFAVIKVGKNGLSYGQVIACFRRWERACHRAKAGRLLRLLQDMKLIIKTKGHSAGSHGTCFVEYSNRPRTAEELEQSFADWINSMSKPKTDV